MARPRRTKAQQAVTEAQDKTFDAGILDKRYDNITSTPNLVRPVRQASAIKGTPIQSTSKPRQVRPVRVTKAATKKLLAAAKPRPSLGGMPVRAPRIHGAPAAGSSKARNKVTEEPQHMMDVDSKEDIESNNSDGADPCFEEVPGAQVETEVVAGKKQEEEATVGVEVEVELEEPPAKPKRGGRSAKAKVTAAPKKAAPEPKPKSASTRRAPARSKKNLSIKENEEKSLVTAAAAVALADKNANSEPMEFAKLKISRVINESAQSKMITFLGTYNNQDAVIKLEKTLFAEDTVKKALADKETVSNQDFANDIYASYLVTPPDSSHALNDIKATVIWPADETVLAKYTKSEVIFFSETPDAYLKVVEPFIESKLTGDYNQWVYNILDGKSEVERVILNDPDPDSGFVIVPDLKWSGNEKDLYLLAICHRRDIRSLRDLNDKHLILLKNILTKGTKAIRDKYKKAKGQLRSYVHYHPSFYHFHVHFKMVDASDYQSTDRDNLLSTVINNITLNKDYYKKSTLTYPLSQSGALYQELKKTKRV